MKKSVFGNFKKYRSAAGLILIGIALYHLAGIDVQYQKGQDVYAKIEETATDIEFPREGDTEGIFDYRSFTVDFDLLKQINEDIVGWLRFDQNGISYPVLQGSDNETYLYRLADLTENRAGSIFLDSLCAPDFSDLHTIVYGHNMRDLSMFGKLKKYETQEGYYLENRYFTIYTQKASLRYEIFAWYEAPADDAVYQVGFSENKLYGEFVDKMLRRRYQDTEVTAGQTDRIVTLSTCSSAGRRFLVHGKLVETF